MRHVFLGLMLATAAAAQTPCCGRGAAPVGERSAVPVDERESPWRADLVFGFDGEVPDPGAVVRAVRRVPGVDDALIQGRWLRVWGPRSLVPAVSRAAGVPIAPAHEVRVPFGQAGAKGRVSRVAARIRSMPGIVDLEIEAEGERGVARVWLRPGAALDLSAVLRDEPPADRL